MELLLDSINFISQIPSWFILLALFGGFCLLFKKGPYCCYFPFLKKDHAAAIFHYNERFFKQTDKNNKHLQLSTVLERKLRIYSTRIYNVLFVNAYPNICIEAPKCNVDFSKITCIPIFLC